MSREKGLGHACGVRVHRVQKVQRVQRGRFLGLTGPMGRKVLRFDGALGPEGCGSGFAADFEEKGRGFAAGCVEGLCSLRSGGDSLSGRGLWWRPSGADYKKAGPRPPVISTEAGQPPIGKPLIVQARGQLRLTWRLYAESPQSGEISPSDGSGGITVGDLSTQSIMGAVPVCLP